MEGTEAYVNCRTTELDVWSHAVIGQTLNCPVMPSAETGVCGLSGSRQRHRRMMIAGMDVWHGEAVVRILSCRPRWMVHDRARDDNGVDAPVEVQWIKSIDVEGSFLAQRPRSCPPQMPR